GGVAGTTVTPTSGGLKINLKPIGERHEDVSTVIRRLQERADKVRGVDLYMQAVQDLTVEDRVSRTQYQYSLEHPDQAELARWSGRLLEALRLEPALRDVATDQQGGGVRADVAIDRDTASRFGITAQTVDDALYSAFGQRQVSTIFTQLNQYHVILEVEPGHASVCTVATRPLDGGFMFLPLRAVRFRFRRSRRWREPARL